MITSRIQVLAIIVVLMSVAACKDYAIPATAPAELVPALKKRDETINDGWRFYCDAMRSGDSVTSWRWIAVDTGAKIDALVKGPFPDDSSSGWQAYTLGQAHFAKNRGVIWLRATLPSIAASHRYLQLSGGELSADDEAQVDALLKRGIPNQDQTTIVFLNGHLLARQIGAQFGVELDHAWIEGGPNVLTLLIASDKATSKSPLSSATVSGYGEMTEHRADFNDQSWPIVDLPHYDRIEAWGVSRPFQGIAWYRKVIAPEISMRNKRVGIEFEGVMQIADVWVNGEHRTTHFGGYLPFTVDLTDDFASGRPVTIAVRVDSRDSALVPPGHPLDWLDFEYYNGIYRDVVLHITEPIHITDAVAANKPAGGGVFVTYSAVSASSATVHIQADVANQSDVAHHIVVATTLIDAEGKSVVNGRSDAIEIAPSGSSVFAQSLVVSNPRLWHPDHPHLYQMRVEVLDGNEVVDTKIERIGIRTIAVDPHVGFLINGEKLMLNGANRHQYYPWIGNALSDNAQYRDLRMLKNVGWNFVRLCHYPQGRSVMDACDELGLVAIVCEPGWQYYKDDPLFWGRMQQAIRDMVRWHRNHPSAVFWEICINEGYAPKIHVNEWYRAVHEELPGDQALTCGDTREYSNHAPNPDGLQLDVPYPSWEIREKILPGAGSRPRIVREYGDWRVSIGEGDQSMMRGPQERQFVEMNYWIGQQPYICGVSLWSYMDYLRGGLPDIASCGVVDSCRMPKFSYYAFQSQRDPVVRRSDVDSGPMVFIANYWRANSPKDVTVYSNCDEVELSVNGSSIARLPVNRAVFPNLPHPPFTFRKVAYAPGDLKAVGYIAGKPVATAVRRTPQAATHLALRVDESGRPLTADGGDSAFVHVSLLDDNGTVVPDNNVSVALKASGDVQVVSESSRTTEGGVASFLIRAGLKPGSVILTAIAADFQPASFTLQTVR